MHSAVQTQDLRPRAGRIARTFVTAALTLGLALAQGGAALALSCAPPDPARDFVQFDASPKTYILVRGALSYPYGRPRASEATGPDTVTAFFSGSYFNGAPTQFDLSVTETCLASWCGSAPWGGSPAIFFIERTPGGGHHLQIGPCADGSVMEDTHTNRVVLQHCLAGGC